MDKKLEQRIARLERLVSRRAAKNEILGLGKLAKKVGDTLGISKDAKLDKAVANIIEIIADNFNSLSILADDYSDDKDDAVVTHSWQFNVETPGSNGRVYTRHSGPVIKKLKDILNKISREAKKTGRSSEEPNFKGLEEEGIYNIILYVELPTLDNPDDSSKIKSLNVKCYYMYDNSDNSIRVYRLQLPIKDINLLGKLLDDKNVK